jgi:calcineurin-like phosphoesterase family protein
MSETFFTSDNHFCHKNIIKYCARPFTDIEGMNNAMIEKWNKVVGPNDLVYHLGDFGFLGVSVGKAILSSLNGKKFLIIGNHDSSHKKMVEMGFADVFKSHLWNNWKLTHRPESGHVLCGHVHNHWRRIENTINVGVDIWDFTPRTFDELRKAPSESRELNCPHCHKKLHRLDDNGEHWSQRCIGVGV